MVGIPTIMSTTSSCQPHHHVNHIIMPTTHHQVVGKCNSSAVCEFTGESTLSGAKPCVFSGNVAESSTNQKNVKSWGNRSGAEFVWSSSRCQRCASGFSSCCDAAAKQVCNWLWQKRIGTAARSKAWAINGICSCRLPIALWHLRERWSVNVFELLHCAGCANRRIGLPKVQTR